MPLKDARLNIALSAGRSYLAADGGLGEHMRSTVVATGLFISMLVPAAAETAKAPILLTPHRAIYDLSLLRSTGSKGVEAARGRIAMEFGGDACDGYTMKY